MFCRGVLQTCFGEMSLAPGLCADWAGYMTPKQRKVREEAEEWKWLCYKGYRQNYAQAAQTKSSC